ncbi:nuclear transport factor 2 family protein [Flavobacterium crassostreae]|uniref:SnoaL-like domain-containing protein n=1 Tax=Flavobacterium crassostreae TaxID=1763534 RepID=A0A1B9DXC6_9FLAO|nr:nuclear transport factor 2 family protein [Flavobacterium crassostreae]OCB74346.1 hypothetical protein LPBF_10115 [Flavobacterium crassostreae]
MKNSSLFLAVFFLFSSFSTECNKRLSESEKIHQMLDAWHKAAAQADYQAYFGSLTEDAIFIGTDATENWSKPAFQAYAKPYFDQGKAWDFKAIIRNIYFDKTGKIAWFDELLDTQMKICRGSGVLLKTGKTWKIKHYVLSMTVPNDNTSEVVKIKTPLEEDLLKKLK